jgi:hypothetical protein
VIFVATAAVLISFFDFLIRQSQNKHFWRYNVMNTRFRLLGFWVLVVGVFLSAASFACAQGQSKAVVVKATKQAFAPPLSQMVPIPPRSGALSSFPDDDERQPMHGARSASPVEDSVLQRSSDQTAVSDLTTLSTNSGLNILGLGTGFPGYSLQGNVPDTNGAAGPTQFVEWVNESFVVFNKSNGSIAYGPANGSTLWQALGAPCSTNNNLDPIVQYDKLANRRVMMMPMWAEPDYFCVAVSTTSDFVNSSWYLYAFMEPGNNPLCGDCRPGMDYPKWGVWPDGYYVTYNQAGSGGTFIGAGVAVVNRNSVLNGGAATMQWFTNLGSSYGTLLPGDVDGTTPPPAGSPEYFLSFDYNDESLDLWQLHVNWTTPADSTFTGPTNIPVAAFTEPCGETVTLLNYTTGDCVPQAGTSQGLDSYGDRLMYRLAYRNFGSYQALVANHTVQVGTGSNQTGIRWYELQNTGSGFGLYQQGTYAPDSSYRWMGSIAMDKAGDIALGYNVSSATMHPSIRYTGRVPTDPLGTMESEVDVLSAAGVSLASQTNTLHWGDYSALAVDPSDDCTFWYSGEYVPTLNSANNHWGTRIASFSFPACTKSSTTWAMVNKTSNAGNPITNLTIPAAGAGHLIAVAMNFNGSTSVASVSDNATGGSNTYVSAGARATIGTDSTEIWYAVNSKSGATVVTPTFVGSPGHVEITVWEVSGISTSRPDVTNVSSGTVTLNNTPGPAVTTTQAGDFILSVLFAVNSDFTAITSGNAFTDDFGTYGNGWAHITSNSAPAGSHQASWYTASPTGVYCASTVAFLPQ